LTPKTDPLDGSSATFEAAPGDRDRRLDVVVAERLRHLSRSRIARLSLDGRVLVDGRPRKPSFRLAAGQVVRVDVPPPTPAALRGEAIPLDIVYEDEVLLVVNKPAGLTVHPGPGHPTGTLVNAVLARVGDLRGVGGELRPGIVHRLDKDTSGLLVVAKSDAAHRSLAAQLKARTMSRTYLAVVRGRLDPDAGTVRAAVGRHPIHRTRQAVTASGRPAVTHYRVLERFDGATVLECRLETGRTHQIRVHFAHLGHPLLGDPVYGRANPGGLGRQALHAMRLEFTHPVTGAHAAFTAPLPADLEALLARLRADPGGAAHRGARRRGERVAPGS
jgi:23S rRNA pseudouridine1911/1915/1917 synthase